mgnify:CR=1 FL=1
MKELFPDVPVIIGGIEASLRRVTHYDYWKDELMQAYAEIGFAVGVEHQFNCHNQFLESQLSNGILASLFLLMILVVV